VSEDAFTRAANRLTDARQAQEQQARRAAACGWKQNLGFPLSPARHSIRGPLGWGGRRLERCEEE
jgi:hypothetical protein